MTITATTATTSERPHWSRAVEAVALYVGGPLVMALALPPDSCSRRCS